MFYDHQSHELYARVYAVGLITKKEAATSDKLCHKVKSRKREAAAADTLCLKGKGNG